MLIGMSIEIFGLHRTAPTIAVALALALGFTGCSGKTNSASEPVVSARSLSGKTVPDVVGKGGDEAKQLLTEAGLIVKFDAGSEPVWKPSNWTVDEQDLPAGDEVKPGSLVTLRVHKTGGGDASSETVTASDAERAASLQQALSDSFGGQTASEIIASDPTLWAGYVNGIRVERDNAYFTLQVAPSDPARNDLGKSAAQALSTLLPAEAVRGIGWIIVEDAGGAVISQKKPNPLS